MRSISINTVIRRAEFLEEIRYTIFIDPLLHVGFNNKAPGNTLLIITITTILSGAILIILTFCAIKRKCVAKKTSVEEPKQQPIHDEIKAHHEEIQMEGNDAYGHMIQCHTSKNWHNM